MENVDIPTAHLHKSCLGSSMTPELIWSKKGFQSIVSGHNEKHYFTPYYTVIVCITSLSSNTIVSIE